MTYGYTNDGGNLLPDEVNYTGNTNGIAPYAKVKFVFEARGVDDQTLLFDSVGTTSKLTKRLARIETSADGVAVKQIKLAYANSVATFRTTLQSVQECSGDDVTCLQPTTFVASTTAGAMNSFAAPFYRAVTVVQPFPNSGSLRQPFAADFNGDGRTDYLYQDASEAWVICFAKTTADGFDCSKVGNFPALPPSDENGNALRYIIEVGDFNGDGKADVLVYPSPIGYQNDGGGTGGVAGEPQSDTQAKSSATNSAVDPANISGSGLYRVKPGRVTATKAELLAARARAASDRLSARVAAVALDEWQLCLATGTTLNCQPKTLVDPGRDDGPALEFEVK